MFNIVKTSKGSSIIPDDNTKGLVSPIHVLKNGTVTDIEVKVNIQHPFVGDLEVSLMGPNGKTVKLHGRNDGGGHKLVETYAGEMFDVFKDAPSNGVWGLKIQDFAKKDAGTLENWTLDLKGKPTSKTNTDIFTKALERTQLVSGQHFSYDGHLYDLKVFVDLDHPDQKTMQMALKAPSGAQVTLHNKNGEGPYKARTYQGDVFKKLHGEKTEGVWKLIINDLDGREETGFLKKWKMFLEYTPIDNLSAIEGLGNQAEAALNASGIHSYSALAICPPAKLKDIFDKAPGNFNNVDTEAIIAKATKALENYQVA